MSTRERILNAAAEVIKNLGMSRATTREIAKAAGFSEATLYKHFSSKEELFLKVIMERMPNFIGLMKRLGSMAGTGTVVDNLSQVASAAMDFYSHSMPMSSSLFSEPELLTSLRAEWSQRNAGPHKANEAVAAYLRAEQKLGRVHAGLNPDAVAYLLLGACFQRAYWSRFLGEALSDAEAEQFVQGIITSLVQGLPPEKAES
ncbi:MAG TPA: TetR/AcrR family transcriptional regulator, partial [Candidatus Obscuribacterales bacterium]